MTDFLKMHGLGNDFVIIDAREMDAQAGAKTGPNTGWQMPVEAARLIADRRLGIGCDQIMIIRHPRASGDIFLEMLNADGSQAGACGNGTRCVADLVMQQSGQSGIEIETISGLLSAWREDGLISVNMGRPGLAWEDVPLAQAADTLAVPLIPGMPEATCVSMGNPHAVLFFDTPDDLGAVDIAKIGAQLELHPVFPDRANIEFIAPLGTDHLRMRVWERGAGITSACGSGACATAVAAVRRGLTGRSVRITLDGGDLHIHWPADGPHADHVIMTGAVDYVAQGRLSGALRAALAG